MTLFSLFNSPDEYLLSFEINGMELVTINSIKLLGIYLNDCLRWNEHITYAKNKPGLLSAT